jgi:hypothetical protein
MSTTSYLKLCKDEVKQDLVKVAVQDYNNVSTVQQE